MNIQNFFSTTDMNLASYLKMRDVDLYDVRLYDPQYRKCIFIFREDKDSERLLRLLDEWDSKEGAPLKRLLAMHGFMKKQVREALNQADEALTN